MGRFVVNMLLALLICSPCFCRAEDKGAYTLVIKDHKFEPARLGIPADRKIILTVENHDPTVEEFESYDLNREKVVQGNGKIKVFLGPLKAGQYKFFGDYHQGTAQGIITAQ